MSMPGRFKTVAGGDCRPDSKRTVASASTLIFPPDTNLVYVSGTTTVNAISVEPFLRNREIWIIGASGSGVKFTNTNSPTAGQMYLRGQDLTVSEDTILKLFLKMDGTFIVAGTPG